MKVDHNMVWESQLGSEGERCNVNNSFACGLQLGLVVAAWLEGGSLARGSSRPNKLTR